MKLLKPALAVILSLTFFNVQAAKVETEQEKIRIEGEMEKMQKDVKRIKETLKSETTKFIPVTIPEAMSIYETEKSLSEHSA